MANEDKARDDKADNVVVLRELGRALRRQGPHVDVADLASETGLDETVIRVNFPKGRQDIIDAVIGDTCEEFDETVTNPMLSSASPREALQEAADGLSAYYEGGARTCLFRLFSVPDGTPHAPVIKDAAQRFLDALATVYARAGREESAARARAHRTFAELQGTLVLGQMTGDTTLFRAFTDQLPRTV
ncbi:hypothetical protein [Parvularcula dongshanensis]|uniref:AcrR family transcriptional regulator n=1 Tax=Parvularcula dongshanensis TaxID=1173995 RepID=A0A840I153_9PROT|nr:hypothetical protein [Parvularcula dongshanensis]MBB4658011.1 AcrR family transcriptional regulator [Parvularcula dongshanensis]